MVVDYVTGICKAIINKKVNSTVGLKGIIKKVGYLLVVTLAILIDRILECVSDWDTSNLFIANEGISILENWSSMGLPLPNKLKQIFEQLRNEEDLNGKIIS